MASPSKAGIPQSRTTLAEISERGLSSGRNALAWYRAEARAGRISLFDLARDDSSLMRGFFAALDFEGRRTEAMGCLQTHRYAPDPAIRREASPHSLAAYVNRSFLGECRRMCPDGLPGGFGFKPLLARLRSGEFQAPQGSALEPFPDLSSLGDRYDWVTFQVDIHDFVRAMPGMRRNPRFFSRFIKEAACVTAHADFMNCDLLRRPGDLEACSLGYAFLPVLVHPNSFGYGPGRFGAAFKLFTFALLESGEVEIRMLFLSIPRSEGVFNFGGFDPVYSVVDALDRATLGRLGLGKSVHDRLDRKFLLTHGRCHQAAIDGMRPVWEGTRWVPESQLETQPAGTAWRGEAPPAGGNIPA